MNGAAGERRNGFSVTALTVKDRPVERAGDRGRLAPRRGRARSPLPGPLTVLVEVLARGDGCPAQRHERRPEAAAPAWVKVPSTPHQVAERNRIRARSRSTTIRVATLWTRPAESRGMTLRQSTGETS